MFNLGPMEMIIVMGIAVLLFGKRLPEVGRSLGKGIVEFKKGLSGVATISIFRGPEPFFVELRLVLAVGGAAVRRGGLYRRLGPKFELPGAASACPPPAMGHQPKSRGLIDAAPEHAAGAD